MEGFGVKNARMYWSSLIGLSVVLSIIIVSPGAFLFILKAIAFLAPIWLPILLTRHLWHAWIRYVQGEFIRSQEMVMIEIKIPRDIEKSPRAMELVFAGIHNIASGDGDFINRWYHGKVRPWWSFEVMSDGGRIHFYVWTRKFLREYTETQIYAEYPTVEIYEVEDYVKQFNFDPSRHGGWGCNFKLAKSDAFPIKSYIDYELDKDPKEEFKIDPISHLFEFLSIIKPGEQVWYQFIIRSNKDTRRKKGTWFGEEDRWKAEAKEAIEKVKDDATPVEEDKEGKKRKGFMRLSPSDELKIKALERSLEKSPFDVGMRCMYVCNKDAFNPTRIGGMLGVFKQFSSGHLNAIIPTGYMITGGYPWESWFGAMDKARMALHDAFKARGWFYPPYNDVTPHSVLTSEELATVYHFPSRSIQAPGLDRIAARKTEAPPNLPI